VAAQDYQQRATQRFGALAVAEQTYAQRALERRALQRGYSREQT